MSTKQDMTESAQGICAQEGYTLKYAVGAGEFKQSFLVEKDNSLFAMKVYYPSFEVERHHREIEALSSCSHENIAKFYQAGRFVTSERDCLWSLEEYLGGGTLAKRLLDKKFEKEKLNDFVYGMIAAIEHMQSKSFVHRDLKPDNIMFRSDDHHPVVVDFGLVRDLSKASVTATWAMHGPGTYFYAAPEQINNEKYLIDWRADQFALGVILSIILIGVHPYDYGKEHPQGIVNRVLSKSTQAPSFIQQMTDMGFPQIIKMTNAWPVERFRNPILLMQSWEKEEGK